MRTTVLLMTMMLAGAAAAVNEAISFHGFLTEADGKTLGEHAVVKIDFKLYPSANAGAELLWARRIPVTLDAAGGFYIDIMDTAGQSYQMSGGGTPTCATLRDALARHAQISSGPLWIAYEVADGRVATPMPHVPLYRQPLAQRASSALRATTAAITSVKTTALTTDSSATVAAHCVTVDTSRVRLNGVTYDVPQQDVPLNPGGSVKLRNVSGLASCAATDLGGTLSADLPPVADSDCGRVVRHVVGGAETLTAIYYSKGDATTLPDGATNVYVWSFGPLVSPSGTGD